MGVLWGYLVLMDKKMEVTILDFRVTGGLKFRVYEKRGGGGVEEIPELSCRTPHSYSPEP